MRAALYLAAALATWYMAGMYRSAALMALFAAELITALVLFCLPRLLRRRAEAAFFPLAGTARKGSPLPCRLRLVNRAPLPAGRVRGVLRMRYPRLDAPITTRRLTWGAAAGSAGELDFSLTAPYCGLLEVELVRVRFYDFLGLFSASRRGEGPAAIPVLPPERAARIALATAGAAGGDALPRPSPAGDEQDPGQLRSYRAGDPVRRIHWNLSARSGGLWVKEHQREEAPQVELMLNTSSTRRRSAGEWSAFFEVLSALVLGLLRAGAEVRLTWLEAGREDFSQADLSEASDLTALLPRLYGADFSDTNEAFRVRSNRRLLELGDRLLELDLDLIWRHSGVRRFQFSPAALDEALEEEVFTL